MSRLFEPIIGGYINIYLTIMIFSLNHNLVLDVANL